MNGYTWTERAAFALIFIAVGLSLGVILALQL
jgi:hypothetical protein